jgi:HSP20 family protein
MRIIRYQNSPLYNPASNFSLRDEMDRLFDAAFPALSSLQREGYFGAGEFPVDLYQDKDAFVVRAELPGFRKEDLGIEVADGILTVTGHLKSETKSGDKEQNTPTQERRVTRSISLPEQVKVDAIQAKYENGVLTVTVPKQEETKPRQIAIDVK